MTILIFGGEGQLGQDIQLALASETIISAPHEEVDIINGVAVTDIVSRTRPDWIINAAAMTDVDRCESEELRAFDINALGAHNVAVAARSADCRVIQISTDYVFDGKKRAPYVESDPTGPLNAYGISKLAGEMYVRTTYGAHYIIRTSGLYGSHPCRGKGGRNFVDAMLRLGSERRELRVVADEVLTPTYTEDLAAQIHLLVEYAPRGGVYHATNDGECSWYDFAKEIFRLTGLEVSLKRTTAAEWGAPAKRPSYSVLRNAALQRERIDIMPHWRDALRRYLVRRHIG